MAELELGILGERSYFPPKKVLMHLRFFLRVKIQ